MADRAIEMKSDFENTKCTTLPTNTESMWDLKGNGIKLHFIKTLKLGGWGIINYRPLCTESDRSQSVLVIIVGRILKISKKAYSHLLHEDENSTF